MKTKRPTKAAKKPAYKQGEKLGTVEKVKTKHEEIAQRIIDALESNHIPWKKPWTSIAPKNLQTNKEYRGINFFLLSLVPTKYPVFATFNQIKEAGGHVLKGSKSVPVYFYKPWEVKDKETEEEKKLFIMRQYQVFTMEQTEGIDLKQFIDSVLDFQPVFKAENLIKAFCDSEKLDVKVAGGASYSPARDYLTMPQKSSFKSENAYYSTMFHEMIHSTGSEKRLKRAGFGADEFHKFGSKGYAFEELVAEFGAAMLATYCGVDTSIETEQSTAYIKHWLKVIKEDPSICYKAASKAQMAVDFILNAAGFEAFGDAEEVEAEKLQVGA